MRGARPPGAALVVAVLAAVAMAGPSTGCLGRGVFRCTTRSQCGPDGSCEATGGCSYRVDAATCSSGRRYGPHAPDPLAGRCVDTACPANPVVAVRAGGSHACLVHTSGQIACWGSGTQGQLGDGGTLSRPAPVAVEQVGGFGPADEVALGANHTCALLKDHSVWCWGANDQGQLGDGHQDARAIPAPVVDDQGQPLIDVAAITAGGAFTCAARRDGEVLCWGRNVDGELGRGSASASPSATAQPALRLTNVHALAARDRHACALNAEGRVWCWGANEQGELGDGSHLSSPTPAPVPTLSDHAIDSIAAGAAHSCASGNGLIWCWGANQLGELGDGTNEDHPVPTLVPLADTGAVTAAGHHTCASKTGGSVWCWGGNQAGQLGEGTTGNFAVPVPVTGVEDAAALTAGDLFSCARRRDGTVWCWGDNRLGQLGTGGPLEQTSPVVVGGAAALTDVTAISAGGAHTCASRATEPRAVCWGDNLAGQLGDGTRQDRSAPVPLKINLAPEQIVAGALHSCLRESSGAVWCWGRGGSGQLASSTLIDVIAPARVAAVAEAALIAAGGSHTCSLTMGRGILCWGANGDGQLGDGTTSNRSNPLAVGGESDVVELALGGAHTCARHGDGTVTCWGRGIEGQLGDGLSLTTTTPVAVNDVHGATSIAAGANHSCAALADQTVRCWGAGLSGQLGWGARTNHDIPSKVMNAAGVVQVAAGDNHSCARTSPDGKPESAGAVLCWGDNGAGQLGNGSRATDDGAGPALDKPALPRGAVAITAGGAHTCALKQDGTVACWGSNNAGQLGDATILQYPTAQPTRTSCP